MFSTLSACEGQRRALPAPGRTSTQAREGKGGRPERNRISLCPVTSCGRHDQIGKAWRQIGLRPGRVTGPMVMPTGSNSVVCLGIDGTALVLRCLDCLETFLVGSCGQCGSNSLRLTVEEAGANPVILHQVLTCSRCRHATGHMWLCPCCGRANPFHLTLGTTERIRKGGRRRITRDGNRLDTEAR